MTSSAALARFAAALGATDSPPPPRSPAARARASDQAGAELERLGA